MRYLLLVILSLGLVLTGCEKEATPKDTINELGESFKDKTNEMTEEVKDAVEKHNEE